MSRVVIVPGLAVQRYVRPAAQALRSHGHTAELLDPPAWRGCPADLVTYGHQLAVSLNTDRRPVSLLVGLSLGTQAATVTATLTDRVQRLLLISPTVDPDRRSRLKLMATFLAGENHPDSPKFTQQLPDWIRSSPRRIADGLRSALSLHLEEALTEVNVPLTIVHTTSDPFTSHAYAAALASAHSGQLLVAPDAPHSWPTGDEDRFLRLVDELLQ
jgi:pimeloyl-ACP methyl ester carboxylesterase